MSEQLRQKHLAAKSRTLCTLGLPYGCLFLVMHLLVEPSSSAIWRITSDAIDASVAIAIPSLCSLQSTACSKITYAYVRWVLFQAVPFLFFIQIPLLKPNILVNKYSTLGLRSSGYFLVMHLNSVPKNLYTFKFSAIINYSLFIIN